jgi:very-short-patch-repair endonuclease
MASCRPASSGGSAQRLVIEIDGGYHGARARADARREAVLARSDYRVLRLDAALVARDIEAALSRVRAALARAVEGCAAPRRSA